MELDVRHLRALCAIADAGSVRKAAVQLGMTQPSLTTQLRRIEKAIGGALFTRGRTGSRPTPLGRSVLSRARPIVAEMSALMSAAQDAAVDAGGARLRIGSTGSRAVAGWIRRIRARLPATDTTIHIDVSSNALLEMLATNQLDVAFVHEPENFPLRVPAGLEQRVVVDREPQFVAVSAAHPRAGRASVRLSDLAADRWIVDPAADDEFAALRRAFSEAGCDPRFVTVRDITTAADLVASGETVSPCQPTSRARQGMVILPLVDDPLAVRLLLVSRPSAAAADIEALHEELEQSYVDAAWASPTYRQWLRSRGSPLLRGRRLPTVQTPRPQTPAHT
ncbi:LysR substrate-binding domain-containing protein [Streptomyces sp. 7N604]|uniref:LysR substrate-binding domain-containing protein n=1 Tax=Streptomyces sp. 7N604 TaxID=3457415 RepID=UPI003FD189A8